LAKAIGFTGLKQQEQAISAMSGLYKLFINHDCTLVEINPMAETSDGQGISFPSHSL
jgi:succinyl-CoA synthetase beta subunit